MVGRARRVPPFRVLMTRWRDFLGSRQGLMLTGTIALAAATVLSLFVNERFLTRDGSPTEGTRAEKQRDRPGGGGAPLKKTKKNAPKILTEKKTQKKHRHTDTPTPP